MLPLDGATFLFLLSLLFLLRLGLLVVLHLAQPLGVLRSFFRQVLNAALLVQNHQVVVAEKNAALLPAEKVKTQAWGLA